MLSQRSRRRNKFLKAVCTAGVVAGAASSAQAQSSFTIGGFLDESIAGYRDANGSRLIQMQDSAIFPTKARTSRRRWLVTPLRSFAKSNGAAAPCAPRCVSPVETTS